MMMGGPGCGAGGEPGPAPEAAAELGSALTTTTNAVRPSSTTQRSYVKGVPDDVNLTNDVKDASPDFDASYVQGGSSTGSSFDLAYTVPSTVDGAVTAVNVKYFARNSMCTDVVGCGRIHSVLLNGSTVIATSAAHDLPNINQGWYMYADSFQVPAGQIASVSNLRTRIVLSNVAPYSTSAIRVSTVAADITTTR
jgi:hypothetical protein